MYAKVGATSTSIRLNKPSMQDSPTHWNSKNYEKKWPENASKRVDFSKFSYPGEGHIPSPGRHPCADSALRPPCGCYSIFKIPPPFQSLCTPLFICHLLSVLGTNQKEAEVTENDVDWSEREREINFNQSLTRQLCTYVYVYTIAEIKGGSKVGR